MLGETFTIVHFILVEVKDIAYDFLHYLRSGRFRFVLVLFLELLALSFGSLYQCILIKVAPLEPLGGTLSFAFLACQFVAVAYHAVSFD